MGECYRGKSSGEYRITSSDRNDELGMKADDVGSVHVASDGQMELGKLERARHHAEGNGE